MSSFRQEERFGPASNKSNPPISLKRFTKNPVARILSQKDSLRASHRALLARFEKSGVTERIYLEARAKSISNGSRIEDVLLAEGSMREEDYFGCVAEDLGLPFVSHIEPSLIATDIGSPGAIPGRAAQVFVRSPNGSNLLFLAPDRNCELLVRDVLANSPEQRQRFRISTHEAIREALERHDALKAAEGAANALYHAQPAYSAKQTFMPWQAFLTGLLVILLPYVLIKATGATLAAAHILASVIFLFGVYLRFRAIRTTRLKMPARFHEGHAYPLYSAMVALHRESAVAPQLVNAMSNLDWPPERLEVIYLCESDDGETISALRNTGMPHNHRIVTVPAGHPRTKPKALNYGLGFASGEYLVIYDAEDRPHPGQLKEAYRKFVSNQESLACLQAPLNVTNAGNTWFSKFFAFEYCTHFNGLLPHLASENLPLPLGGTSNHFKRDILLKSGGWDPYNVTEDADLGIRLARLGYQTGVLQSATLEDGPETIREWLPQRVRWQKGWMQTALVHSRNVREFFRSAGTRQAVYTTGIVAGFILAPLLYPLGIASFAYSIMQHETGYTWLAITDILIFLFGFIAYSLLGFACDESMAWHNRVKIIFGLPFYWLWISLASWLALGQLVLKPHHWNKTPHRPARNNAGA